MQSFMQHVGSGSGAAVSYFLVVQTPSGALAHLDRLAWVAGTVVFLIPLLAFVITRLLRRSDPEAFGPTAG